MVCLYTIEKKVAGLFEEGIDGKVERVEVWIEWRAKVVLIL